MEEKTYRTGDVKPPKNYRQVITLLLLLVLFLGCLVSALGFANIRLFQLLEEKEQPLLSFGRSLSAQPESAQAYPVLGLTGSYLTPLEQEYFSLPAGIYVVSASHPLLQVGDVVISINDTDLSREEACDQVLSGLQPGTELTLEVLRNGRCFYITDVFYEGDQ